MNILGDCPDVFLPSSPPGAEPVWHLFVLRHPRRDALLTHLAQVGISALIHYPIPPHRSQAYKYLALGPFPVSDALAGELLSLPIHPFLSTEQLERVGSEVRTFCLAR
jgi:dTDP-4-amino-4,6-dideoxygalactose transaminase